MVVISFREGSTDGSPHTPYQHVVCVHMKDARAAEIGRRIEAARKRADLSRPELADLLQVHTNTITGYERGDRAAYRAVTDIAERTNSDVRWLVFGDSYQDPLDRIEERLGTLAKALEDAAAQALAGDPIRGLEDLVQQLRDDPPPGRPRDADARSDTGR
jgi:transcriptional regulator with XRE-family HTH domain